VKITKSILDYFSIVLAVAVFEDACSVATINFWSLNSESCT